MTAKNPKPLTRPRNGEPNHGKFCNAPGSLPPESNLPMQPSLKEQMHGAEKDPVQVPPFDHKACILCDHVIVQQVLGNKCKLSGALCCYMRSCPEEDRKKREAVKEARENPCEENGCTDIENCDEICQHSRIYSPVQMQQAIAQATEAENRRVLDEFSRAWRSGSCPNPMAPCSMDDGKNHCPICIAESLRLAQPEPTERDPE